MTDLSENWLKQAKEPEKGINVEKMVLDEEEPWPFEADSFDLIISNLK